MDAVHYTLLFLLIIAGFCTSGANYAPIKPGGLGPEHPANSEIQALCDLVKCEFETQSGVNAAKFVAIIYRSQVVAGTNFFVKVLLGGHKYCHVKIFKPLPHTHEKPSLNGFQLGKSKHTPITYF